MTFRIKTIVLFMLLSIVPIGIVSSLVFVKGRTIVQQKTEMHLAVTNNLKSETLKQWIQDHVQVLDSVSKLHAVYWDGSGQKRGGGAGDDQARRQTMGNHLGPFIRPGQFLELFVVDLATGQVVFSTDPVQEGKYRDDQAFFKEGRDRPFVQDIVFDLTSQKPVMFFSTPMARGQAVLAGRADLSGLSRTFENRNVLSETEDTYLVNKFNYFITEPRFGKGHALKKSISGSHLALARENGRFLGEYDDYRGVRVFGETLWLEEFRLFVVTEIDRSEALEPVRRLKSGVLLIALGLTAVAALAGWLIAATITEPLTALMEATGSLGRGEFKIRLDTSGKGELYGLARSFKNMAERLEKTMVSKELLEKEVVVRRAAEAKLKKTVKALKASNQDLQQFAYVASHDLQEPLRMVSSFTQLLGDRYRDELDARAQKWIGFAVDGAARMQKLIQDLLSFSRVNTHGHEFEETDLKDTVEAALENLKLAVEESGARIRTSDLPKVRADGGQMVMLFQNLIGNSIKFCRDRSPEIRISSQRAGEHWVIRVEDNGIGIESEFADKIFVIFQRLHTREQYPGTGLGLALCKRVVQRHGGRIWVTSKPGEGTTFHISLPAGNGPA
jgi:signal transduction histidine kinase